MLPQFAMLGEVALAEAEELRGVAVVGEEVEVVLEAEDTHHAEALGDADYSELEELRRFKLQVESSKGKRLATQEPANTTSWFGNFAGYAHTGTGIQALASTKPHVDWIVDSGASRHVTGAFSEFAFYDPNMHMHPETVQTADGTAQPVRGIGSVHCTPSFTLLSVLHVPSFPVNLISVSSIIVQLKCKVTFDENF